MRSLEANSVLSTAGTLPGAATIKRLLWQGPARLVFSILLVLLASGLYTIFPVLRSHDILSICLLLGLFIAAVWGFEDLLTNIATVETPHKPSASLLDALKEELFHLEADRLHGRVNQQEYQAAKGVLDKTLREATMRKN